MRANQSEHEKKSTRTPKTPTEILRTKAYLFHVCDTAEIKRNGSQLEHYFEPEKFKRSKKTGALIRSCKYDKLINGNRTPSKETVKIIEQKLPDTSAIFYSPIWSALTTEEQTSDYWYNLYRNLSLDIQVLIFEREPSLGNNFEWVKVTPKTIEKIQRIGGLHALACLLAMAKENKSNTGKLLKKHIENAILKTTLILCCTSDLNSIAFEFFELVKQQVIAISTYRNGRGTIHSRWQLSREEFEQIMSGYSDSCFMAQRLNIVKYDTQMFSFLYWLDKGDTADILNEMKEVMATTQRYWKISHSATHGLKWLTSKLNTKLPRSEKVRWILHRY